MNQNSVRRARKDMTGMRFGRLVAIAIASKRHKELHWQCLCDCGRSTVVRGSSLRNGHTTSCGVRCGLRVIVASHKSHGLSRSPTWNVWAGMRKRCNNPRDPKYPTYGGRGIKLCERWDSFENFLADMGERPAGMTIDRWPNKDGNYEPGNCRWATQKEQQNNRRNNRLLVVNGETMTMAQLSDACGMSESSIRRRLKRAKCFETSIGVACEAK